MGVTCAKIEEKRKSATLQPTQKEKEGQVARHLPYQVADNCHREGTHVPQKYLHVCMPSRMMISMHACNFNKKITAT